MRCRECAAEVAAAARVCPRCGAPIAGQQPPVVADTVAGAVSETAVSDAAGKAVPAGVAVHPPVEPYVPGSGDRVPADLRLVLAGYAGIAGGLLAGALALAAAAGFLFDFADSNYQYDYLGLVGLLALLLGLAGFALAGPELAARIRFSRLLRRRSDPRTATVTASRRGGRTLILDIIPGDGAGHRYQSLSEVRLALWLNAGMLVPGETVNVYGASGKGSQLLISSPLWGRAFLGTVESQSALQPRLLDEKVSGATLVDWAAWAASTTFSSTGRGVGYETREVDAFRSAVRDTFLGGAVFWVSTPPVRSDDIRGKKFTTHRDGYDKTQVDAFVEAAGLRLAAMESTDRPAGALVSGDILVGWAEWVELTGFSYAAGYRAMEVDAFKEAIRDTFLGVWKYTVKSDKVRGKRFSSSDDTHPGYDKKKVAAFLDAAGIRLAAMESTDRPAGPLASDATVAEWAEWADSTRFSTTPRLREGYATAEVDVFRKELRDTFLGARQPPLTWDEVQRKWPGSLYHPWFSTTRGWSRPGYDIQEVDAFLKMAKLRLAAIRLLEPGSWPILRVDRPAAPPVSGIHTEWPSRPTQRDFQPPPG